MDHTYLIVQRGCREWVNALWSDMSIRAMALEQNVRVVDLSFLEWIPVVTIILGRLVRKKGGLWSPLAQVKNLPPTEALPERYAHCKSIFFFGWLFRNPVGFEKYRTELLKKFGPSNGQRTEIERLLAPHSGKQLIGVYVRTRPFRFFPNGEFLVSREATMRIVGEYVRENRLDPTAVTIIETSDRGDEETTFHLLSRCSIIIGTNSTYCNLAAWFGNVPHVVTLNEPIDWDYYQDKKEFFDNKYATFAYGGPTVSR